MKRRTIRRRLQTGEFEHAYRDPEGAWQIPVNDLLGAGLRPNLVSDPDEPRIVFSASSQVERLRTEVAVLRERVRALEIIAKEREERVTDLRTILRMLPAPKEPEPESPREPEAIPEPPDLEPEFEDEAPPAEAWEEELEEEFGYEPLSEEEEEGAAAWSGTAEEPTGTSPFAGGPATEPLLVLPDAPSAEDEPTEGELEHSAELLETARQRTDELLEDAMSMWWPSASAASRAGSGAPGASRWGDGEPRADIATRTVETPEVAAVEKPIPRPAIPADPDEREITPQDVTTPEGGLFTPSGLDEYSFEWLDPEYSRPPRHLRRRLGRFFRRQRKPT